MNYIFRFSLLLVLTGVVRAAPLVWSETDLRIQVRPNVTEVPFSYEFINRSQYPIVLTESHTSCGCTLTKIDSTKVFAPSEKAQVQGTYRITAHGSSSVSIKLNGEEIDGDKRRPFSDTLTLTVSVKDILGISPGISLWRKGAGTEEKRLRINVFGEDPLRVEFVGIDGGVFEAKYVEIIANRTYELVVIPKSTEAPVRATATFEVVMKDGTRLHYFGHFLVR
jgi:hypothetical protein